MLMQKMTEEKAALENPVTLAFLGDAVFSLFVREKLVLSKTGKAADFQRAASRVESARGQSAFVERVLPLFTETENAVYHRGRNAKKATKSKNASAGEYSRSTGFEAVLGYLYLTGNYERVNELLSLLSDEDLQGRAAEKVYKP